MTEDDTGKPQFDDLLIGFALLTRMPLPHPKNFDRSAAAAWTYPLVGAVLSAPFFLIGWLLITLGVPEFAAAGVAVAALIFATGALHEDGLADMLDGLWGGWDRAQRLDIMKDSRIGAYGVLGLAVAVPVKISLIAALFAAGQFWAILVVMTVSRAAMVVVMYQLPNARQNGLSAEVGRPALRAMQIALAIAVLPALVLGTTGIWMLIVCAGMVFGIMRIAEAKIGGQTGDILGATQQITELVALVVCAALLI